MLYYLLSFIHSFIYFFETGYCHVAWIGFELTTILLPQLLNAGLTHMCNSAKFRSYRTF